MKITQTLQDALNLIQAMMETIQLSHLDEVVHDHNGKLAETCPQCLEVSFASRFLSKTRTELGSLGDKPYKVLVEVYRGVADVTICPEDVAVDILDHDNLD